MTTLPLWISLLVWTPPIPPTTSWSPIRPDQILVSPGGNHSTLEDDSIQFAGATSSRDATLTFRFRKPTRVRRLLLELLPDTTVPGRELGTPGKELRLFEVRPSLTKNGSARAALEFSDCRRVGKPEDDLVTHCIDYLHDTGWLVPRLGHGESHQLVLELDQELLLDDKDRFVLELDLGGGSTELGLLSRIRLSLPVQP